ncbi:MAG: hypothetical protein E6G84_10945 [Alphaproteobacteria bacterium]|nr:MAG: hypothetical protein E6G88_17390 [Alphaproteobacteria bacterium]TMJ49226.1 MAG: hypothetical protein E6G84_10945 [Alphaproteobacteria bacterium]
MGWKLALCAVAAGLAFAVATNAADARPEKRTRVAVAKPRPVTRIIVTRRSYLDGGKEYLPGHPLPANQGIYPPNFVPSTHYDIANQQVPLLYPVPNLFWLPGWQP